MSRSNKKAGYYITMSANKPHVRKKEKITYNRRWRRISKRNVFLIIKVDVLLDVTFPKRVKEIVDVWWLAQDGNYILLPKDDIFYHIYKRK
jgi:hypothetical protein